MFPFCAILIIFSFILSQYYFFLGYREHSLRKSCTIPLVAVCVGIDKDVDEKSSFPAEYTVKYQYFYEDILYAGEECLPFYGCARGMSEGCIVRILIDPRNPARFLRDGKLYDDWMAYIVLGFVFSSIFFSGLCACTIWIL